MILRQRAKVMGSTVGSDLDEAVKALFEAAKKLDHATHFNAETDEETAMQESCLALRSQILKIIDKISPPQEAWPHGKAEIVDLETHRRRKRGG